MLGRVGRMMLWKQCFVGSMKSSDALYTRKFTDCRQKGFWPCAEYYWSLLTLNLCSALFQKPWLYWTSSEHNLSLTMLASSSTSCQQKAKCLLWATESFCRVNTSLRWTESLHTSLKIHYPHRAIEEPGWFLESVGTGLGELTHQMHKHSALWSPAP